jgi:nucleoside-diphosphate-sugar epimerase
MGRILVTGALGQIGSELVEALRTKFGNNEVVAGYFIERKEEVKPKEGELYEFMDVRESESIEYVVKKYEVDRIYHMASVLSAKGEKNPQLAFQVNFYGVYNILEVGRKCKLTQIILPSSIAVFGEGVPRENTPNDTILQPKTIYGISKVTGELLGDYYFYKYGLDVRGLRYPGIISYNTLPGGGTTDYAVEMFYGAILKKRYTCFLKKDTILPMMYMPDCINALLKLSFAPLENLKHHCNFNVGAFSFSPEELAQCIKKYIPDFKCTYEPDFRQKIAETWPKTIDDTPAREEWNWSPQYDLEEMTKDMLQNLRKKLQ